VFTPLKAYTGSRSFADRSSLFTGGDS